MTDARDIVERDANDGLVCSGCGSTQSIEQIRAENPKALSCCPERRMVPQISDIVERLRALHVWPQFVADEHADVILPRQSKGLYEVGHVAHEAADTIASLRKQLEDAREALNGYRAAVSFISADSWDGCSDCINILKAARCADMTEAMTINETAEHLKRIRLHYDPAALRSLPTDDGVTDEMVERAAKAICYDAGNPPTYWDEPATAGWVDYKDGVKRKYRNYTRAALEAALGPLPAPPAC